MGYAAWWCVDGEDGGMLAKDARWVVDGGLGVARSAGCLDSAM